MIQWSIRLLKRNDNWTITPLSHISHATVLFFVQRYQLQWRKNKSFKEEKNQSTKEVGLRCLSDHEWHDITRYNFWSCHKNQWENYIALSPYHTTTSGSPQNNSHFVYFVMAPSGEQLNSFSTSTTSLVIGRFKIWLGPPFLSATRSVYIIFCISINTNYSCHRPLIPMTIISQQNNVTNCKVSNPLFPYLPYL